MPKDKAHVEEIISRHKHKSTPVLMKFQNGELKNAHKDTTIYFPAKSESDPKRNRAVVVTSGNVYSGPIIDDSQELVDQYICIRNKTTNKVRILPIDQVKLINHVYEDKKNTVFALLPKDTARDTAMRIFGGRRDLRNLNARERNNVNVDVLRDQLETSVENFEGPNTPDQKVNMDVIIDTIRPKFNKDATNLHSVFSVYDIIPMELIDRLDEEVSVLMTTDIDDIPISSEFLKKAIVKLKSGPQSIQTLLKMKMILYMDALQTLIKSWKINLSKIELSKITEKVENDIRARFTSDLRTTPMRTSTTNEKALCYFLVLGFLISDDFQLDLNMLSTELGMSKVKIAKFANLVSANCSMKTNCLTMRLPSTLASSKRGKKK